MEVAQILMPMAGAGSRFKNLTSTPKPLIRINQKPMYQWALESLPQSEKCCFVVNESFKAEVESLEVGPGREVIGVRGLTEGQAITTQVGLAGLTPDQEVIVSACDHSIVLNPERWRRFKNEKNIDAAIFVVKGFPGVQRSPESYAYVQVNDSESYFPSVTSVSVKKTISETPLQDALLVGTFWFRNSTVLERGIKKLVEKNKRVRNEFYLLSMGLKVVAIELDGYMNWGDPQSLSEVLYWHECFAGFKLAPRAALQGVDLC
jgi:NDP-sugar pyrophosphorylase family protein